MTRGAPRSHVATSDPRRTRPSRLKAGGSARSRARSFRLSPPRVLWPAVALGLAFGCGDDPARIVPFDCTFGPEHRLATPEGVVVDDVAIAVSGERILALWSDRAGTFARQMGSDGAPDGPSRRITARCDGGLAVAERGDTIWIACGRRGDEARDDEGAVQLLAMRQDAVEARGTFGALGPDGRGVAIAIDPAGGIVLGWQHARGPVRQAWIARAAEGAPPSERISTPFFQSSAPALAFDGDRLHVVWAETWLDARGRFEGRIQLRVGSRAPRAVADIRFEAAMPALRPGPDGGLVLAFRDRRPPHARPRMHLARVDGERLALNRIERSLPANTAGEAIAVGCEGAVLAVAPRTRSRTERLIAIRRYSPGLEGLGPEHQMYEHGSAFEHADARCVGGALLVLGGARETRAQRASVRAARLTCAGAGAPAAPVGGGTRER